MPAVPKCGEVHLLVLSAVLFFSNFIRCFYTYIQVAFTVRPGALRHLIATLLSIDPEVIYGFIQVLFIKALYGF